MKMFDITQSLKEIAETYGEVYGYRERGFWVFEDGIGTQNFYITAVDDSGGSTVCDTVCDESIANLIAQLLNFARSVYEAQKK